MELYHIHFFCKKFHHLAIFNDHCKNIFWFFDLPFMHLMKVNFLGFVMFLTYKLAGYWTELPVIGLKQVE